MELHLTDESRSKADSYDAYERLLLDSMLGDATLYARGDAVEASWRFVAPILEAWEKEGWKEDL